MRHYKRRRTLQAIFEITFFLGFMLAFATVGAMEQNTISLGYGIVRLIIGLVLFAGAGFLGGIMR